MDAKASPGVSDGALLELIEGLTAEALVARDGGALLAGFCTRLGALGVPLLRVHATMPTRDPVWQSVGITWSREGGVLVEGYAHGGDALEPFRSSPFRFVIENICELRQRLDDPGVTIDFPFLVQLRDEGATDYLCKLISFRAGGPFMAGSGLEGMVMSWATDRPGGFATSELILVDRLFPTLALALYRLALQDLATGLLASYVGADAGRRVLGGQTRRGEVESLDAVILLCDLRGFTATADILPGAALVALLDAAFEATIAPVEAAGGQILKFLGDGFLATFSRPGAPAAELCGAAIEAARNALAAIAARNAERRARGLAALDLDIALHLGTVMYGNVGSERRIDFTVIGPAVNEASRIEALCATLGRNLLMSASFARAYAGPRVSLGEHRLRGVARAQELFALAEDAAMGPGTGGNPA